MSLFLLHRLFWLLPFPAQPHHGCLLYTRQTLPRQECSDMYKTFLLQQLRPRRILSYRPFGLKEFPYHYMFLFQSCNSRCLETLLSLVFDNFYNNYFLKIPMFSLPHRFHKVHCHHNNCYIHGYCQLRISDALSLYDQTSYDDM